MQASAQKLSQGYRYYDAATAVGMKTRLYLFEMDVKFSIPRRDAYDQPRANFESSFH